MKEEKEEKEGRRGRTVSVKVVKDESWVKNRRVGRGRKRERKTEEAKIGETEGMPEWRESLSYNMKER